MIERHVTFDVLTGQESRFEKFFLEEYRPAMESMPGFQKVDLLRECDHTGRYVMVIRFDSAEHAAEWRASAAHMALQPRLKELHSGSRLVVHEVVA